MSGPSANQTFDQAVEGARNLLVNCAGVRRGDRLLILHEEPDLGWYDGEVPLLVAGVARDLGVTTQLRRIGGPDNRYLDANSPVPDFVDADCDCCIFFARVGDQLRFERHHGAQTRVMCYATSVDALASRYGRTEHQAMVALKNVVDDLLVNALQITVSCPLGSALRGSVSQLGSGGAKTPEDVTVRRFPVGVHAPIDASHFSGTVRLARYLTTTGSRVYDPTWIAIHSPVTAEISNGRVAGYQGDDQDVGRIGRHYEHVSTRFSLPPDRVLSWHAGIHPACRFSGNASDDPDRWSNTVFTSPRFAHFHTCGNGPPGEICWMVLDPTICVDEVPLWDNGVLNVRDFAETRRCLEIWPCLAQLFDEGSQPIGLAY